MGRERGGVEASHLHFALAQRETLAPYLLRKRNAGVPAFRDLRRRLEQVIETGGLQEVELDGAHGK
jgi:hypothetical protein